MSRIFSATRHPQREDVRSPASPRFCLAAMLALGVAWWCLVCPLPLHVHVSLLGLGGSAVVGLCPHRKTVVPRLCSAGLIGFIAVSVISVLYADHITRALLVNLAWAPALLLAYAIATRVRGRLLDYSHRLLVLSAGTLAVIFSISALLHPHGTPSQWVAQAGYAQFSVPNDLLFLCLFSPFALYLITAPNRNERWLGIAVMVMILICLILYETRGGLLLLIFAVVLFFISEKPRISGYIVALTATLLVLFSWLTEFALLTKITDLASWAARVPLWLIAWEMFLDRPWLGHGPGAFALLYPHYAAALDPTAWPIFDPRHVPWAHHLYLELLSERGILGLSAFIAALAGIFLLLYPRPQDKIDRSERYRALNAVFIALMLTLIGGLFEFSLLRYWFVMVLALLCSIAIAYSHSSEDQP